MQNLTIRATEHRLRSAAGERLAGFIYGTIVALAVVVAGAKAYPDNAWKIAVLVSLSAVALWVAHVYAHALGHSVAHDERVTLDELRHIARREGAIIEAAALPVGALLLGAVGAFATNTSVWLAFGAGLAFLAVQGVRFARIEHLGPLGACGVVAANVSLGLLLAAVKLLLSH